MRIKIIQVMGIVLIGLVTFAENPPDFITKKNIQILFTIQEGATEEILSIITTSSEIEMDYDYLSKHSSISNFPTTVRAICTIKKLENNGYIVNCNLSFREAVLSGFRYSGARGDKTSEYEPNFEIKINEFKTEVCINAGEPLEIFKTNKRTVSLSLSELATEYQLKESNQKQIMPLSQNIKIQQKTKSKSNTK